MSPATQVEPKQVAGVLAGALALAALVSHAVGSWLGVGFEPISRGVPHRRTAGFEPAHLLRAADAFRVDSESEDPEMASGAPLAKAPHRLRSFD
jgi:hypothetical protein